MITKMEIQYKNLKAKIIYSSQADVFYGEIRFTADLIVFQGKNLKEAELAMRDAVDQYFEYFAFE